MKTKTRKVRLAFKEHYSATLWIVIDQGPLHVSSTCPTFPIIRIDYCRPRALPGTFSLHLVSESLCQT